MKRLQLRSAGLFLPAFAILAFMAAAHAAAPTVTCPGPLELESNDGTIATLRVNIRDDDGNPLVVVWTVDGISYQVNNAPGGVSSVITSEGFPTNYVPATGTGGQS